MFKKIVRNNYDLYPWQGPESGRFQVWTNPETTMPTEGVVMGILAGLTSDQITRYLSQWMPMHPEGSFDVALTGGLIIGTLFGLAERNGVLFGDWLGIDSGLVDLTNYQSIYN